LTRSGRCGERLGTLFIAMFERDYAEPLGFQREYAARLAHFSLPYPDITT
jgi:hypothetical protein